MKFFKEKSFAIAFAMLLILVIAAATLWPNTFSQVTNPPGTRVPTYAYINVGPNPAGVGQTVTINFFLATPTLTSEFPTNLTVVQTNPDGTQKTLGPFTGDTTGGSYTTFVPDVTGNYTFQTFYAGQTLSNGVINLPSNSTVVTLVVQQEPIQRSAWPITPLPSAWWETPVTAENVQNWYKIMGPWLGLGQVTFAITGGYNLTGNYNPYTQAVLAGHVLWTKPWGAGGVAGGDAGGTEDTGNYWTTRQYQPQYAPIILNGIMYSTWYTADMVNSNGILATNLYTGETMFTINTTNPLKMGMNTIFQNLNQYGVVGPYIFTEGNLPGINSTGTQWNMYDAVSGRYVCSVINGPASGGGFSPSTGVQWTADSNGNLIGYYINSSATNAYPPTLNMFNMTVGIGMGNAFGWGPTPNGVFNFSNGIIWSRPLYNNISGAAINPGLAINGVTANAVVMTGGFTFGQFYGGLTNGWLIVAAQDATTGAQLWIKNFTSTDTDTLLPYTRTQMNIQDGVWINVNMQNFHAVAYNARTGAKAWDVALTGDGGASPNHYDIFNFKTWNGPGVVYFVGFGGDIWCVDSSTGAVRWYTNTTKLVGDPGIETPYDIWPLWVFGCDAATTDVAYFAIGHEYNPPLFHGAQLLAVNNTNGQLVWSELDMSIRSTAIAYGVLLSLNAYDNQIYAFGKGPSATTINVPSVGATTATPVTISGRVTDVSAGAEQDAVRRNFPNGLPCVSDESQSKWMEYVYQQQPIPLNTTGVQVTISVVDANNNFRQIGTTTTTDGSYAFTWTPDISGNFQVIVSFSGSNSYWPSSATANFYASNAATTSPTTQPPTGGPTNSDLLTYLIIGVIAIIIVVIIVGAVIAMRAGRR